jgi:translocation and assembly module TamA
MRSGALAGLLLTSLAGCAGVQKPEGPEVDLLELKGAKQISQDEVKQKILTAESSFLPAWIPLLGHTDYFDPNAWQADLRRIERYYQSRGFYQARVLDDHVVDLKPGHVAVVVQLKEGPVTHIASVTVNGLDALPADQQQSVQKKLPLQVGEPFLEDNWNQAKQLLATRLKELGYAEAAVEGEALVEVDKSAAALTLSATVGQRYRFGNIFVATDPDAQVTPKQIVEQVEGAIVPGEWYSESALNEAQGLVFQMGVFGAVKVNRGAPDRAEGTVPVVVDVKEAPFHTIRIGPGIGIDPVRHEIRLVGEYTDRNLFGGLRRLTLRGKAGYAFLPTVWGVAAGDANAKSGPVFRILTEFEQPRLFFRTVNLLASIDLSSGLEPGYGYIGGTGRLGLSWRPTTTLTIFPSYNLDVYRLYSPVPLGAGVPEVLFGCPMICVISYLEQTVEWDRRDNKIEPRTGTYLALSLQEGGLGGVFRYFRIQPEARGYLSFGEQKRVTLAMKLKVGTLLTGPNEDSPIIARFFSGGSSMRGFSSRRLSPLLAQPRASEPAPELDPNPNRVVPGETLPLGGKGLLEASVELRWKVWGDLMLSVFNDTGIVTQESLNFEDFGQFLYTAVGFGVRYLTALGPIRVDLAVRLPLGGPQHVFQVDPRTLSYPTGGCFFGLGQTPATYAGYPEGVCSFHLSIGEAF